MGKIIKNNAGKVLTASGGAFEVTAAIDSNITAGNIKKDVTILGVTGTYEGSGGGSTMVSFTPAVNSAGYYVAADGTVTSFSLDPYDSSVSFECMSGSLIYIESLTSMSPNNLVGATIITSRTHGSRGQVYVWILQAD